VPLAGVLLFELSDALLEPLDLGAQLDHQRGLSAHDCEERLGLVTQPLERFGADRARLVGHSRA
jgi:hypothetical protein